MTAGQIGLVYDPAPWTFGALVSEVTRSPAFHAVVGLGGGKCLSAEVPGARIRDVSEYGHMSWSRLELDPIQTAGVVAWAQAREGRPYAVFDDVVIGVHDLAGRPIPRWLAKAMTNDRSYMCSELSVTALRKGAGVDLFPGLYAGEVAPSDIDALFTEKGWHQ